MPACLAQTPLRVVANARHSVSCCRDQALALHRLERMLNAQVTIATTSAVSCTMYDDLLGNFARDGP